MHLLCREPQAGHFQEFGAETFDDWLHVTSLLDQRERKISQSTLVTKTTQDGKSTRRTLPLCPAV
jgi:hypothetical protein